jgi:hypothetical protein
MILKECVNSIKINVPLNGIEETLHQQRRGKLKKENMAITT